MQLDEFCFLIDKNLPIRVGGLFRGCVVTNILTYNQDLYLVKTCSINYKI